MFNIYYKTDLRPLFYINYETTCKVCDFQKSLHKMQYVRSDINFSQSTSITLISPPLITSGFLSHFGQLKIQYPCPFSTILALPT